MARSARDKFLIEYMRSNFTQEDLNIKMRKIGLASQQITIINLIVYSWYQIPRICKTMGLSKTPVNNRKDLP
nr:MAG TPA: TrfB transcriptional repressor protein/DNA Complex-turn-helix, complex, transcription.5A [Caudoviricetes sp.]